MTKKHGHEDKHAHCEHCLHACDHCDVAYCCDCNREWGTCNQPHYWFTPTPTYPHWGTTTTIYDATSASPTTTSDAPIKTMIAHAHRHEN